MKKAPIIIMALVTALFVLSWIFKAISFQGTEEHFILSGFKYTLAAFLTLAIFSFLYRDNPFYKFAEHLFVGVSAAFWMTMGFWSTIVGNLIPRVSEDLSHFFEVPYEPASRNLFYFIPVFLGILLLMRLSSKYGWLSRWPLAFIVGTTAGFNFVRYLRSDFINQISATFIPLLVDWHGIGHFFSNLSLSSVGQLVTILSNLVLFLGVFCGLIYFFFSKEHKGAFGAASRVGIWILMITFGASFGYTVMGRISLLVGRLTFLFKDWLELIS
ncbi:MAG: hypothetical protein U9N55_01835 [candidate division Zixibacteria bacterium]|nr:hypothetical protein [candidate division Zixibacteria bacterium]